MNEKVILVVAGYHREFQIRVREMIWAATDKLGQEPVHFLTDNRFTMNGETFLYMPTPDHMRGILADEIQYWGTYHRRPERELELFRIIGNSRIKRKEKV